MTVRFMKGGENYATWGVFELNAMLQFMPSGGYGSDVQSSPQEITVSVYGFGP